MRLFVFFLLFLAPCVATLAEEPVPAVGYIQHCYPLRTGLGRYCVNQVNGSKNSDVVYFMHGIWMKPEDWPAADTVTRVSDRWLKMGKNAPTVVSISYGRLWLATPPTQDVPDSLLVDIGEHNIPEIEQSLGLHPRHRRIIGASMGGFNAAQLALRYPWLFDRVALLCPAILNLSPHAPYSADVEFKREADQEHVGARLPFIELYKFLGSLFILNEKDWEVADPFNVLKTEKAQLPKFLISCGREDPYGFFKGAHDFTRALAERKDSVQWYPVEGKHCSFNAAATKKFIFGTGADSPDIVSASEAIPPSVSNQKIKHLPAPLDASKHSPGGMPEAGGAR